MGELEALIMQSKGDILSLRQKVFDSIDGINTEYVERIANLEADYAKLLLQRKEQLRILDHDGDGEITLEEMAAMRAAAADKKIFKAAQSKFNADILKLRNYCLK